MAAQWMAVSVAGENAYVEQLLARLPGEVSHSLSAQRGAGGWGIVLVEDDRVPEAWGTMPVLVISAVSREAAASAFRCIGQSLDTSSSIQLPAGTDFRTTKKPLDDYGFAVLTSGTGAPLLAWQRFGEGISVAFTSDAEGRWGAAWLTWPDSGRFWTRVVRAALRRDRGSQEPSSVRTASYANELRIHPTHGDLLRGIAAATGGVYQPAPESVWTLSSPGTLPPLPIHHWLLAAAAVLYVLDAAARRLP